ncbi:hypothetical protein VTK73DRAFT_4497 [Phialemonium thermophilum]|uniref:UBC core domain-containing protein n=1 Tax=Phialemonium thermophilum TaxID=223376 RepID=A0ABR3WT22_9PEZI
MRPSKYQKFSADVSYTAQLASQGKIPCVTSTLRGPSDWEVIFEYKHPVYLQEPIHESTTIRSQSHRRECGDEQAQDHKNVIGEENHYENEDDNSDFNNMDFENDNDDDSSDDNEVLDAEIFGLQDIYPNPKPFVNTTSQTVRTGGEYPTRLREDLGKVKEIGFEVSVLHGLDMQSPAGCRGGTIAISIPLGHLGLSEPIRRDLGVHGHEYVVLLLRYEHDYHPLESLVKGQLISEDVHIRAGICGQPEPAIEGTHFAFRQRILLGQFDMLSNASPTEDIPGNKGTNKFRLTLITNALHDFMGQHFNSILDLKLATECSWDEVLERFRSATEPTIDTEDRQGALETLTAGRFSITEAKEIAGQSQIRDGSSRLEKHLVKGTSSPVDEQLSFPLLAAEFASYYLRNCTSFCLVCHATDDIQGSFEVQVIPAVSSGNKKGSSSSVSPDVELWNASEAVVYPYDIEFDSLTEAHKSEALRHVLDTLPPIKDIQSYLMSEPQASLSSCPLVSPTASKLLQWIVAVNRYSIQEIGPDRREYVRGRELGAWKQFRLVRHTVEHEAQFKEAVERETAREWPTDHRTIFAWHGSPTRNWHSILRTGLNFRIESRGRAYGDGVYFSRDFDVSKGYSLRILARELKAVERVQSTTPLHELGWYVHCDETTNLFHWIVELHSFDTSLPLAQDLRSAGMTSVVLEVRFGRSFPTTPPFIRVIRPRFLPFLAGGGGHVTAGGALCMELLTNSGWSPANSLESVLVQVRLAICGTQPAARLARSFAGGILGATPDYGVQEAVEAYRRAARVHGWAIPPDLDDTVGMEEDGQRDRS